MSNKYIEKIASKHGNIRKGLTVAMQGDSSTRAEKLYHKAKKIKDLKDNYDDGKKQYHKIKNRLTSKNHRQKKMKKDY